jgi:thiol-disulfide isomerase/thioredoxin
MTRKLLLLASVILIPALSAGVCWGEAKTTLPQFKLKLVDGKILNSKSLAGKVTIVDFWGTWCAPCIAEIPEYNAFYKEYKSKGIYFVALAADSGTLAQVGEAAKRLQMEYPVAVPSWEELDLFGNIEVFPTTLVFDGKGQLVREFAGATPSKYKVLRQTVDSLLQAK